MAPNNYRRNTGTQCTIQYVHMCIHSVTVAAIAPPRGPRAEVPPIDQFRFEGARGGVV